MSGAVIFVKFGNHLREVLACNVKAGGEIPSQTSYIAGFRGGIAVREPFVGAQGPPSSRRLCRGHQTFPTRVLWRRQTSVSYTHLDVYKRQHLIFINNFTSRYTFFSFPYLEHVSRAPVLPSSAFAILCLVKSICVVG